MVTGLRKLDRDYILDLAGYSENSDGVVSVGAAFSGTAYPQSIRGCIRIRTCALSLPSSQSPLTTDLTDFLANLEYSVVFQLTVFVFIINTRSSPSLCLQVLISLINPFIRAPLCFKTVYW